MYRIEHKEEMRVYDAKYLAEHLEQATIKNRRRRARKLNAPMNDLTAAQWKECIAEYQGLCAYCLKPMTKTTQDHMTPLACGGSHTLSNVVPCCGSCNSKKYTKTLLEYVITTRAMNAIVKITN